jgi:hypothetical protein
METEFSAFVDAISKSDEYYEILDGAKIERISHHVLANAIYENDESILAQLDVLPRHERLRVERIAQELYPEKTCNVI